MGANARAFLITPNNLFGLSCTCFSLLMYRIHRKYELSVTSLIMGDPPVAAAAAIAA